MGIAHELATTLELDSVGAFISGGTPEKDRPEYWDGVVPWVTARDLKQFQLSETGLSLTSAGAERLRIAPRNSILILVRGMTLFKDIPVALIDREMAFNQDIKAIIVDPKYDARFVAYQIVAKKNQILGLVDSAGHGTGRLDTAQLKSIAIWLPPLPDQKKIAAFLGAVDEKLNGLRRNHDLLADYKRGVMQQLLSQKLRFKSDDGSAFPDWEVRELQDIAERCTAKNSKLTITRVLTNSAVQGVVDQGDYFDKDIANAENLGGYYIVERGDFVYNPRISETAPVGPIKRNNLETGVMSPLYLIFRMDVECIEFFAQYFDSSFWHEYLKSVANYGARHDRMAITTSDFMSMPLPWPDPDEQRKIADFLSALDTKIDATAEQIIQTEAFKKGLLQKMFV
ncbi:MAG: restriction endonuclease subunit S [Rhizobiaceae bacterium]|nr:restriction endonuclease subunit S [Rhizobiaceae bacterium]